MVEYLTVFDHVGFFFAFEKNAMISTETHDMVRVASAANPFEAHILEQTLRDEGIRCQVLGDYLGGGIGNVPGMMAEVWVESSDLERAEAILRRPAERAEPAGKEQTNG